MKKTGSVLGVLLPAVLLVFMIGCVSTGEPVSEEEFYKAYMGTWTNPDNEGTWSNPQKVVYQKKNSMVYGKLDDEWQHSTDIKKHYEVGKISGDGGMIERFGAYEPIAGWSPGKPFSKIAENNTPFYNVVLYKIE